MKKKEGNNVTPKAIANIRIYNQLYSYQKCMNSSKDGFLKKTRLEFNNHNKKILKIVKEIRHIQRENALDFFPNRNSFSTLGDQ